MNILDGLTGEHAALLTVFEHLEQYAPKMDLPHLREAGRLLDRLLRDHSNAEDELLFDRVATSAAGLRQALAAMRAEHAEMARELERVRAAVSASAARGSLLRLIQFTREHFALEQRVLFHLAAIHIGAERLAELGAAWQQRRLKNN